MHVMEESNDIDLKKAFVLVYMYNNETHYPDEGNKPAPPSIPVGLIFFISLVGGMVAVLTVYVITLIVLRQMRKRKGDMIHHGQTTPLS